MRALLSVYDKEGLVELAGGLSELGWELVASGNTAAKLSEAGIAHIEVAQVTGSPEMLGGRVKTLHPKIHGGILADRSKPEHLDDLAANGIDAIDLVVSNLYPFSSDPSVELIDIGGPAMVRAAAKNHEHVGIVTSPADYPVVLEELRASGLALGRDTPPARPCRVRPHRRLRRRHRRLARRRRSRARRRTSRAPPPPTPRRPSCPRCSRRRCTSRSSAPTSCATARTRTSGARATARRGRPAGGTEWSSTGATRCPTSTSSTATRPGGWCTSWRRMRTAARTAATGQVAVAIIKHANPCGAAVADSLVSAYERALECDPLSAFGGVVAIGGDVTDEVADAIAAGPQADVIIASSYTPAALEKLIGRRKATRIMSGPPPEQAVRQLRSLGTSVLVQDVDAFVSPRTEWRAVTKRAPTEEEWRDLVLAWRVCGRTTSNAIAIVTGGQAVGVGAGQQSRVVAAEIAVQKAGERAKGGAGASDAFFPFPDGLLVLADAGVTAVVQPGGSVKDPDVIAAADEAGLAMVMTGERHFRH